MNATKEKSLLTHNITSYDLLKTFAVIVMIIDHVGLFFMPDQTWLRSIGRLSYPIWFFLIGFSSRRNVPKEFLYSALILQVFNYIAGIPQLALNILLTIALIRLIINKAALSFLNRPDIFWTINIGLLFLIIPTSILFEYGTQGLICAVFGHLIANKDKLDNKSLIITYFGFTLVTCVMSQQFFMLFPQAQLSFMGIATFCLLLVLYNFKSVELLHLTEKLPKVFVKTLHLTGRYTLEIYVVHLALFKVLYVIFTDTTPSWFEFVPMAGL